MAKTVARNSVRIEWRNIEIRAFLPTDEARCQRSPGKWHSSSGDPDDSAGGVRIAAIS
jgi:hypothetical protein